MENQKKSNYNTIGEYITNLALENRVGLDISKNLSNYVSTKKIPESMEEALSYANFWRPILEEFKDGIGRIDFFYQEKDKHLPLSYNKKLLNLIGFNVKPKMKEGEIKYDKVNVKGFMDTGSLESPVRIFTDNEDEWKRLNAIWKNTDNFSAPFVQTLKPLCYRVNIPLECINGVNFNQSDFLDKEYKNTNENKINPGTGTGTGVVI